MNSDKSDRIPGSGARVCSVHFTGGAKSNIKESPAYIPTNFPTKHRASTSDGDLSRFKRSFERQNRYQVPLEGATHVQKTRNPQNIDRTTEAENVPHDPEEKLTFDAVTQTLKTREPIDNLVLKTWHCQVREGHQPQLKEVNTLVISHESISKDEANRIKAPPQLSIKRVAMIDIPPQPSQMFQMEKRSDKQFIAFTGVSRCIFEFLRLRVGRNIEGSRVLTSNLKLQLLLIKLKSCQSFRVLGGMFNISERVASKFFFESLDILYLTVKPFVIWFDRSTIQARMPISFKGLFPNTRAIIDCSEIPCEMPSGVEKKVQLYSHYKSRHTVKFLVASAPSGEITFISNAFGGRITDTEITTQSGFLNYIEPGDEIMADKGFPHIETNVNKNGGILIMPPFKRGGRQFTKNENDCYRIASVRIHIERCIQRMKIFRILNFLPLHLISSIDKILIIISFICNCRPDLIQYIDE